MATLIWDDSFRIDVHKGVADVHPPHTAHTGSLHALPDYLRSQGFDVSFVTVRQPQNYRIDISGFKSETDIDAAIKSFEKKGYTASYDPENGVFSLTGFRTHDDFKNIWKSLDHENLTITRKPQRGEQVQVLRIRGLDEKTGHEALSKALQDGGFVEGEPKDPYEGMNPLQKGWAKVKERILEYAGWVYLCGDTLATISGLKRGLYGETFMGLGFGLGSLALIRGKRDPRSTDELLESAIKDFTFDDEGKILDFDKADTFRERAGSSYGTFIDTGNQFLDENSSEVMAATNQVAGLNALYGGVVEGKRSFKRDEDGNVIIGRRGRPETQKKLDVPLTITGVLLSTGFFPSSYMSQTGSGKVPMFDFAAIGESLKKVPVLGWGIQGAESLANSSLGQSVLHYPRMAGAWIMEAPKRFAGWMARSHNFQQIGFAIYELFNARKEIREAHAKMEGEARILGETPELQFLQGKTHSLSEVYENLDQQPAVGILNTLHDILSSEDSKELDKAEKYFAKQGSQVPAYAHVILDYLQLLASPDEVTQEHMDLFAKAIERFELDMSVKGKNNGAWRIASNSVFVLANTLFSHGDSGSHLTNSVKESYDVIGLYEKAAALLQKHQPEDMALAVMNLSYQLSIQPEMKAYDISQEQLATGIAAKLRGAPAPEELLSMQESPWMDKAQLKEIQKSNGKGFDPRSLAYYREVLHQPSRSPATADAIETQAEIVGADDAYIQAERQAARNATRAGASPVDGKPITASADNGLHDVHEQQQAMAQAVPTPNY